MLHFVQKSLNFENMKKYQHNFAPINIKMSIESICMKENDYHIISMVLNLYEKNDYGTQFV